MKRCLELDTSRRPLLVDVHGDLVKWVARELRDTNASNDASPKDDADQSSSWRSGLRMVRELLRPVPPNRTGPPSPPPPSPPVPLASLLPTAGLESQTPSCTSGEGPAVCSEGVPLYERPLPRSRLSQTTKDFRSRPGLPKLPPVLEVDWENSKHDSPVPSPVLPGLVPKRTPQSASGGESPFQQRDAIPFQQLGLCLDDLPNPRGGSPKHGALGKQCVEDSRRGAAMGTLVVANFAETPHAMMEMSIVDAFQRWNFTCPVDSCCLWHASLRLVAKLIKDLSSRPCNNEFQPILDWQCPRCFLMDQLDNESDARDKGCTLCGYATNLEFDYDDDEEDAGDDANSDFF